MLLVTEPLSDVRLALLGKTYREAIELALVPHAVHQFASAEYFQTFLVRLAFEELTMVKGPITEDLHSLALRLAIFFHFSCVENTPLDLLFKNEVSLLVDSDVDKLNFGTSD